MGAVAAVHFIFYVRDQESSAKFYETVLGLAPSLHVPGMTEFVLEGGSVLGLMPSAGIRRLLGGAFPDPEEARGVARSELYLTVADPQAFLDRAVASGARLLSPLMARDWGDDACYVTDLDGHVVAFARPSQ